MSSRELMSFPGGLAAIPQPTRADLLLSAGQWLTRARESIIDCEPDGVTLSALDHLERALKEIARAT